MERELDFEKGKVVEKGKGRKRFVELKLRKKRFELRLLKKSKRTSATTHANLVKVRSGSRLARAFKARLLFVKFFTVLPLNSTFAKSSQLVKPFSINPRSFRSSSKVHP